MFNWPRNMPKPDCRIIHEMESITNPVTYGVYRNILKRRKEEDGVIDCPFKE